MSELENCGDENGVAQAIIEGGKQPYTINWQRYEGERFVVVGQGNSIRDLGAGLYKFIVRDANGCTKTKFVSISSLQSPKVEVVSKEGVSCSDTNDGRAILTNLGEAIQGIRWFNETQGREITIQGDEIILENLPKGDQVLVLESQVGCKSYFVVTIEGPDELILFHQVAIPSECFEPCNGII